MGRQSPLLGAHSLPYHHSRPRAGPRLNISMRTVCLCLVAAWVMVAGAWYVHRSRSNTHRRMAYVHEPVLISYAYYEKDPIQVANFEYFLAAGSHYPSLHTNMHWVFVVAGDKCTPCASLEALLGPPLPGDATRLGVGEARGDAKFTLLRRVENAGMDLGSHNVTLEWLRARGGLGSYRYFIFLNSSAKGPFYPAWLPPSWHWTHAFLEKLQPRASSSRTGGAPGAASAAAAANAWQAAGLPAAAGVTGARPVAAVGASLVCLPKADAGGPGPRLEAWAFALTQEGLAAAVAGHVFTLRGCKLCEAPAAGVVVGGEYGLTSALFRAGYNIATLLSKYDDGIDWTDPVHWSCNDNVHPSRQGTYQGISAHPYETLFVKASWHVAEPYTRRYSAWTLDHLLGKPGTQGTLDEVRYRYAISVAAQHPRDLERAYDPLSSTL